MPPPSDDRNEGPDAPPQGRRRWRGFLFRLHQHVDAQPDPGLAHLPRRLTRVAGVGAREQPGANPVFRPRRHVCQVLDRDQEVASYEYLVGPQVYGRRLVGLRRRNREIDRFREQVFADTVAPHGVDVYAHVERVHALASRQIEPHPLQLTPELSELAFHAHLAAFLPGAERRAETVLLPMLRPKV